MKYANARLLFPPPTSHTPHAPFEYANTIKTMHATQYDTRQLYRPHHMFDCLWMPQNITLFFFVLTSFLIENETTRTVTKQSSLELILCLKNRKRTCSNNRLYHHRALQSPTCLFWLMSTHRISMEKQQYRILLTFGICHELNALAHSG